MWHKNQHITCLADKIWRILQKDYQFLCLQMSIFTFPYVQIFIGNDLGSLCAYL